MTTTKNTALLPVLPILLLGACMDTAQKPPPVKLATSSGVQQDEQFVKKLAALKQRDPITDAQQAIKAGKPHFLCNIGRSSTVPGLTPETYSVARNHCPTQCLEGVSDAIYGRNHAQYLSVAVAYSASWNQVVIDVCGS